jgi:hypothetical protein
MIEQMMIKDVVAEAPISSINGIPFKEADYLSAPDAPSAGCLRREAVDIFKHFIGQDMIAKANYTTDFMGGITSETVSEVVVPHCNSIQKFPIPGNWHGDTLEWMGTLKSALDGKYRYRMAELGAGWAPWCAIAGRAAKMRGLDDIRLFAVEGHAGNVALANKHLAENGMSESQFLVRQAIVGAQDGTAEFPKHVSMSHDYGAVALFSGQADRSAFDHFVKYRPPELELESMPCLSLKTVIDHFDGDILDLIHCDVQGTEEALFDSDGLELMSKTVRRVVVAAHSYDIERILVRNFGRANWECEGLHSTIMREDELGEIFLMVDGCQVWRNPHLD